MESTSTKRFAVLQSSRCPLLDLPGELRNHIYDYCVELGPVALPSPLHDQSPSRPLFGGLRHACKTLYVEFTPIYLDRTVILIHSSNPGRYISAVYPKQQTLRNDGGHVNLSSPNIFGQIKLHVRIGDALDLTPFAGLLARAPYMSVEFASTYGIHRAFCDIADVLKLIMDASCSVDFENTVERIMFRCSLRSQVVLKLHRHVMLEDLFADDIPRIPRSWLIRQGFSAIECLEVVMESSEGVIRDPPSRQAPKPHCGPKHLPMQSGVCLRM